MKILFDCAESFSDQPQPCTLEWLESHLDSAAVTQHCAMYELSGDEREKKALPVIIPMAHFTQPQRRMEYAEASGLVMIDIDDHEGSLLPPPDKIWRETIQPRLTEHPEVLMVYITASGRGLRIIAKRTTAEDIETAQRRLFHDLCPSLSDLALDTQAKDLTRCSFLTDRRSLLYLDAQELFHGETHPGFTQDAQQAAVTPTTSEATGNTPEWTLDTMIPILPEVENQLSDDGSMLDSIPMSDIVDELRLACGCSGAMTSKQMKGQRNTKYYELACHARHLCRTPRDIIKVLPEWGLSLQERMSSVLSACKSYAEGTPLPSMLTRIIRQMDGDEGIPSTPPVLPNRLPQGLRELLEPYRPDQRGPLCLCALPALGTLATEARFRYHRTEVHALNFITCLMAPQASGKGQVAEMTELLLKPLIEESEKNMKLIDEFKDDRDVAGENGKRERNPHLPIRIPNPVCTAPALIEYMKNCQGKHMFMYAPEIDALSSRANNWAHDTTLVRNAFDNGKVGQTTKSLTSTTANLPCMLNLVLTGTYLAVTRYFRMVEDGTVGRVAFCTLPDNRLERYVPNKPRRERDVKKIEEMRDMLLNERMPEGVEAYDLSRLENLFEDWCEDKRQLYSMTMDESLGTFYIRAAVMGFRAGCLAWLLEGKRVNKVVLEFASWVANSVLYYQDAFFGQQMRKSVYENKCIMARATTLTPNDIAFIGLNNQFTNSDVALAYQQQNYKASGARAIAARWVKEGWCTAIARGVYLKTEQGIKRAETLRANMLTPSLFATKQTQGLTA